MNSFELDIFSLFLQASFVVQLVMIILLFASVSSWWVISERWTTLSRTKKDIFNFEKYFWSQNELENIFKNISKKHKKIGLEQIIPAIFLIAVLILVLPGFLETNSKLKQFLKNLSIWSIIVVVVVIASYFISK